MQKITVSCVISFKNDFLLVKGKQINDNWAFPSKVLDEGENVNVCIEKKVYEDTGLKLNSILKKVYLYHENGIDEVNFLFISTLSEKPLAFQHLSSDIEAAWFSHEEIEYILNTAKDINELERRRFKDLLLGFGDNLSFTQL